MKTIVSTRITLSALRAIFSGSAACSRRRPSVNNKKSRIIEAPISARRLLKSFWPHASLAACRAEAGLGLEPGRCAFAVDRSSSASKVKWRTQRTAVMLQRSIDAILDRIGSCLAAKLRQPLRGYEPFTPSDPIALGRLLRPADVLLVDGNQRISSAIKYLTQSTWSHAALYVGETLSFGSEPGEQRVLIEANLEDGVVAVPLSKYLGFNIRICRPVGLTSTDRRKVIEFMIAHLGCGYDTRHVIDLARYLLSNPPVPVRWRRRMLALGSGEPTRTICSTLIAAAFESVRYPVLPRIERLPGQTLSTNNYTQSEILHIRDHRLFVPRDFDVSPYFQIVKPTIESGFDYRQLTWARNSGMTELATTYRRRA